MGVNCIRFLVTSQSIKANFGLRSQRVILTPDDTCVFRVELFSGHDIILVGYRCSFINGEFAQDVSIFDRRFTVRSRGYISFLFTVLESDKEFYTFNVDIGTPTSNHCIGTVKISSNGLVTLNDEVVDTVKSRRLWVKALTAYGGRC